MRWRKLWLYLPLAWLGWLDLILTLWHQSPGYYGRVDWSIAPLCLAIVFLPRLPRLLSQTVVVAIVLGHAWLIADFDGRIDWFIALLCLAIIFLPRLPRLLSRTAVGAIVLGHVSLIADALLRLPQGYWILLADFAASAAAIVVAFDLSDDGRPNPEKSMGESTVSVREGEGKPGRCRKLWLCLPPASLCLADHVVTLWHQPSSYWAGGYSHTHEGSPHGHWLLSIHPLAYAALAALYLGLVCLAIVFLPRLISRIVAVAIVLGHSWGTETWSPHWGTRSWIDRLALFAASAVAIVLALDWSDRRPPGISRGS